MTIFIFHFSPTKIPTTLFLKGESKINFWSNFLPFQEIWNSFDFFIFHRFRVGGLDFLRIRLTQPHLTELGLAELGKMISQMIGAREHTAWYLGFTKESTIWGHLFVYQSNEVHQSSAHIRLSQYCHIFPFKSSSMLSGLQCARVQTCFLVSDSLPTVSCCSGGRQSTI